MLDFYHNIPQMINPIAFSVGFFDVRWYSLMYIVGLFVCGAVLRWRIAKKETDLQWNDVLDFLLYGFVGALVGGRVGYVLFYNFDYYRHNLLSVFVPAMEGGKLVGFYGMSYHGAVLGFVLVAWFFLRKKKVDFWKMMDFAVPAIPLGYFFGRVGNFLNGELYGRATDVWWGMRFGNEKYLRHPSQLYEAFFEGIVLFLLLWTVRNKWAKQRGKLSAGYLVGYGVIRFCLEFWREPDWQIGRLLFGLTLGQILSLLMILAGLIIGYWHSRREIAN